MQPIKTVSTRERIVRNAIVTAMVAGFSAWSIYDGYVGYPRKNLEIARQDLPAEVQDQATINPLVTTERHGAVKRGASVDDAEKAFGKPTWSGSTDDGYKAIWIGPAASLAVEYNSMDVIKSVQWKDGQHSETDLVVQKVMGFVLAPIALLMLIRLVWMSTQGATLSDEGLKPSGRTLIPYDEMTGWDTTDYKQKGRIELSYSSGGKDMSYTLDDYKLRAFPTIVSEIADRRGFESPFEQTLAQEGAAEARSAGEKPPA